jgi:uncharacterized damage-inducible protein DinB
MWMSAIAGTLTRDVRTLRRELEAYPDEKQIWQEVPGIVNTAGTLALHLTGNIQHYVGMHLGGSSYVRDRPAEFAKRGVKREDLLKQVAQAEAALKALDRVDTSKLEADFPEAIGGSRIQAAEFLIHTVAHFTYHLGQIDYHRRVVTGLSAGVDAVKPTELRTARAVTS